MEYILTCSGCDDVVVPIDDDLHLEIIKIIEERGITLEEFIIETLMGVGFTPPQKS